MEDSTAKSWTAHVIGGGQSCYLVNIRISDLPVLSQGATRRGDSQSLPLPCIRTESVLPAVKLPISWLLCVEISLFLSMFSGAFPMVLSEEECPPGLIFCHGVILLNASFVLTWVTLSSLYWRKSWCNGSGFEVLLAFLRLQLALKDVLRRSFGPVDCHVTSNVALMRATGGECFCGLMDLGQRPFFPVANPPPLDL